MTKDQIIAEMAGALKRIAYLRPGGPTRNRLVEQMERIAIDAFQLAEAHQSAPLTIGYVEPVGL
jgi:hypothetical protein